MNENSKNPILGWIFTKLFSLGLAVWSGYNIYDQIYNSSRSVGDRVFIILMLAVLGFMGIRVFFSKLNFFGE